MRPSQNTAAKLRRGHPPFATLRTIIALILREMATTYGRSPGGYLWAILEPALGIALMVIIFSAGFRAPPLGSNFGIYYASGFLPYIFFTSTSAKVQQSINFSRQLLAYPRVTFIDTIIARFTLNMLTQLIIGLLIFSFILTNFETRTVLRFSHLVNAYAMAGALGFGFGMLNCVLISRQPIWQTIWSVITRPLVLVSGVIFMHDNMPEPYRSWLDWNPLVHVTGESRRAFYYSYQGDYISPTYPYFVALVLGVFGLLFLKSYSRDLMER